MLHFKSKKINSAAYLCILALVITPVLSQAETALVLAVADTGSTASRQATEQREALAKKAAEREAKKAAEAKAPVVGNNPTAATSGEQQKGK